MTLDRPSRDGTVEAPPAWHALSAPAALDRLGTGPGGLPDAERDLRRSRFGPNAVAGRRPEPWWKELLESFTEPLQLLLIGVAVLSAVFGEIPDAIAIAVVISIVAVMETVTELRAARDIDALRTMAAPTARLVRDGGIDLAPAAELVPGDVVVVEAGDVVPADARVLTAHGLRVDESSLTGESAPVGKGELPVSEGAALAERTSLLHSGSAVVAGEGRAVVVATGAASELGRLGRLVAETREPPTPLQRAMSGVTRWVLVAAIAASVVAPLVGILAGQPWRDMLLAGLTLAFATVPEELPILVTALLAVGGRQLARRGALLRHLRAGETLGEVTTVVTDKTGTLTENRLRLAGIVGDRRDVLTVALGCQPTDAVRQEPIETELAEAAHAEGLTAPGQELAVHPFDPSRRLISRAHRSRVVAFARRRLSTVPADRDELERELDYVGLAGFDDPLREGVPDAIAALTAAGVSTIVVTGDHAVTAAAIAAKAGLAPGEVLSGAEAEAMPHAELDARLVHGAVIARATPKTKHRVVQVLQGRHEVVALTGDGANDAPALAAADVGIALGARGADLARAAADLVLVDDAYPTVVTAIGAGRNITAQLRRAVAFYLAAKLALVTVMIVALAVGLPSPFAPVHIVLLEIFMDLGASVAFVAEPAAPDAMHRPPRAPGARFMDRGMIAAIVTTAASLVIAVLPAYLILTALGEPPRIARAGAVLAWLAAHVLIAWTLRTQPWLSWRTSFAFPIWAGVAILVGLLAGVTPIGGLIGLGMLPPMGLAVVAGLVLIATLAAAAASRLLRL